MTSDPMAELHEVVGELGTAVKTLRRTARYNRAAICVIGVLAVVVLILGLYTHSAADRASTATNAAHEAQIAQTATCNAGNESRALLRQLFTTLIDEGTKTANTARYLAAIDMTFAPRACT